MKQKRRPIYWRYNFNGDPATQRRRKKIARAERRLWQAKPKTIIKCAKNVRINDRWPRPWMRQRWFTKCVRNDEKSTRNSSPSHESWQMGARAPVKDEDYSNGESEWRYLCAFLLFGVYNQGVMYDPLKNISRGSRKICRRPVSIK